MKKALFIEANRTGYSPDQCGRTLTVGELISFLQDFDEDREVYLRHDNGYTFGGITEDDINAGTINGDEVELEGWIS